MSHLWSLKVHLPLIHNDLIGAGLWSSKEGYVLILESLQWFRFTSLIHRNIVSTHAQPEIMRETTFFTLRRENIWLLWYHHHGYVHEIHFHFYFLTSTSKRVEPYPGHSLMMLMYFSMAWCCGMPCRRAHFSSMLVRVADVSSFTHISSLCSPSTWNIPWTSIKLSNSQQTSVTGRKDDSANLKDCRQWSLRLFDFKVFFHTLVC